METALRRPYVRPRTDVERDEEARYDDGGGFPLFLMMPLAIATTAISLCIMVMETIY